MDSVVYRDYRPEDYENAMACINDFYDGGYPYPELIERENIERRISSGELIFIVAEEKGRIVGTFAALHEEGAFHGGVLFYLRTVPFDHRGRGISSKHIDILTERVQERFPDVNCYYADIMTHDAVSQGSFARRGFQYCGMRCFAYKNELIAPKIAFPENTKMTQIALCRPIKRPEVSIFVPESHKEAIKSIYDNLGVKATFKLDLIQPEGKTDYELEYQKRNAFSEFIIKKVGSDFRIIEEKVKGLLAENHTLLAYINMKDEGSNYAYRQLRKLGFYYSGISPLFYKYEYMIMSQSDNCVENFDDVCIFEKREEIINYILGGRRVE